MEKKVRKAVRCYLIKNKKVVAIKYKQRNKMSGYYDIPGGKIEERETPKETAIREMKEETGLEVNKLKYKGNMIVEYPEKIFDFDLFIANESQGTLQESEENTAEWIEINDLLQRDKILSCIMILDKFFIKVLINNKYNVKMNIKVDNEENILEVGYRLEEVK